MNSDDEFLLSEFSKGIIGLPVSHIWNGAGSSLFLEFGRLNPTFHRDGTSGNPDGEMGLMIEWSWRIEGKRSIICGSWSDDCEWKVGYSQLLNKSVSDVSIFGRLPEIDLEFSNGAHCVSFMTERPHPVWAIFDRRDDDVTKTLHSRYGELRLEES